MGATEQLQVELNEALRRKNALVEELRRVSFCVDVFQKEIGFRTN